MFEQLFLSVVPGVVLSWFTGGISVRVSQARTVTRLDKVEKAQEHFVTREEFNLLRDLINAIHNDVREIRNAQRQEPRRR